MRPLLDVGLILLDSDDSTADRSPESQPRQDPTDESSSSSPRHFRVDAQHESLPAHHGQWNSFRVEHERLAHCLGFDQDRSLGTKIAQELMTVIELQEPFQRVQDAIAETLNTGRGA